MFYRYEIKKNNNENVLYLYLNMNYEFSKELTDNSSEQELTRRTKNFIKNKGIDYDGSKVFLIVDGIIVKSLDIGKKDNIEILKEDSDFSNDKFLVNLEMNDGTITEITLKDYLLGTLATNTYLQLEFETLKATCLLYRTYAYKEMSENKKVKAKNEYVTYKPISYYKLIWNDSFNSTYLRLSKAITDTDCEFVAYQNSYILPFIHITNNGYTSENSNIPYLKRRSSLWDYASPYYLKISEYSYERLENILKCSKEDIKNMEILRLSDSNKIEIIKVGNKTYTGRDFQNILSLRSDDITILVNPHNIKFITRGFGNSLGMSQFGANEMANAGYTYTQILHYYFVNITIKKYV